MRQVAIPIEEWLKLVESGVCTPATIIPKGNSMWPLIRGEKDVLEVKPVNRDEDISSQIKVGDIIVFKRCDGTFVVHRVWKMLQLAQGKVSVQTYGDNCRKPDAPVPSEEVCGIVTKIYRDGKIINPSSGITIVIGNANRSMAKMRGKLSRIKHFGEETHEES